MISSTFFLKSVGGGVQLLENSAALEVLLTHHNMRCRVANLPGTSPHPKRQKGLVNSCVAYTASYCSTAAFPIVLTP